MQSYKFVSILVFEKNRGEGKFTLPSERQAEKA